ncbi:MAG: carboxyl transferase domain-containing protein, partial [Haloarculaceae archaeon]
MKVRIAEAASREEAAAIASALARHRGGGGPIEVYVGDATEPTVVRDAGDGSGEERDGTATDSHETADVAAGAASDGDDLGPTDRERRLRAEIADIRRGGPEKYRERLAEQGKLFVRDRLELWFGESDPVPGGEDVPPDTEVSPGDGPAGVLFEDGTFANFDAWHPDAPGDGEQRGDAGSAGGSERSADADRLPADGLLTGAAEFEGRRVHFMANDFTVKAGSMAEHGVEKFLRMQQRALKTGRPVLYLMDSSGGRIDRQRGFFANREGIGKYYYNHSML